VIIPLKVTMLRIVEVEFNVTMPMLLFVETHFEITRVIMEEPFLVMLMVRL